MAVLSGVAASQDVPPPAPSSSRWALRRDLPPTRTTEERARASAIAAGLSWLRVHQVVAPTKPAAGFWDADDVCNARIAADQAPCDGAGSPVHDVGNTALAVLALLGHGAGLREDADRAAVERGLQWLMLQQGKRKGLVGTDASHDFIYDHALASVALCDAYGLLGGDRVGAAAQKAIDYLDRHHSQELGWRYQPRSKDSDTSVTTWCIQSYVLAADLGLRIDEPSLQRAARWYALVTDPVTGKAGYTARGESSARHPGDHGSRFPPERGEALTASALYGRHLLEQPVLRTAEGRAGCAAIEAKRPEWSPERGTIDFYYWYHGCYALASLGQGESWLRDLEDILLRYQRQDGHARGSWDPIGVWGEDGGRVYSTALALLILAAPTRFQQLDPLAGVPATVTFRAVRRHWAEGRFDRAQSARDRIAGREITGEERAALAVVDAALAREDAFMVVHVERLGQGPDYYLAREELEEIAQSHAGLEAGARADAELQRFRADERIQEEIKASKARAALLKRYGGARQPSGDRLRKVLDGFLRSYPGTYAAAQVEQWRALVPR